LEADIYFSEHIKNLYSGYFLTNFKFSKNLMN
jgi:hypothetical protein